ncbi:MAG TPA: glycosyltransferase family 39 protein [Mycobacteriales bacterium]|nr:glycosyltransferase family 39 protein [Mycobacteriales bacterium]
MTWTIPSTVEPEVLSSPKVNSRLSTLFRGRTADPRWVRPSLLALLVATAALYFIGLGSSGWANAFYSAAVQAGSTSWKAFFYGSSDAANSITVDKPPASLWVMALSVKIFGLHSWSILAPQALEGVGSVALLYATVRRWFSPGAALLSGAVLALTPVATLMFRFNNPDALLVLLLVAGAYATVRAVETASTRWLVFAGFLVGSGFLVKMLQAFLVVPAFALVYLLAAPTRPMRRIRQLLLAGLAMLVSAGWWVAIVELVPARDRPYIGGSQHNSVLELIFGYNGFGRITGNETGSVGGGGTQGSQWGATGWSRLFGSEMGGQISWLIPAALALLVAMLWLGRRAGRTDRTRAAFLLWGGWLLVTGLVFSFMQGIVHPYYTVALAPAIAALVGMGTAGLWARRRNPTAMAILAAVTAGTAIWSYVLLDRSADWNPWLRGMILVVGLMAAVLLLLTPWLGRHLSALIASVALVAALAGPTAYSIQTAATAHTGAIPSAGPTVQGGGFGAGGRGGGPGGGQFRGQAPGGQNGGNPPQFGNRQGGGATSQQGLGDGTTGQGGGGGGMSGLLGAATPSATLVKELEQNASSYTWVAATTGANNAAGYQLTTNLPVMPIGGFNGTDPSPTLSQFEQYVSSGQIHYYIASSGMGQQAGSSSGSTTGTIASWVASHFTATTVGGVTIYDLTQPTSGASS